MTSSEGQTLSGPASPLTATGLTNGVVYTFTVTATNGAGTGPASEPSEPVVPLASPLLPTGTMLSTSSNPALVGASVTFAATVLGSSPTGSVTFIDGADPLGTAPLSGSRATITTSTLEAGQHSIMAIYEGDDANAASASLVLPQMVSAYTGVVAIAAGAYHTVALKSDGSVVAWGDNYNGQTTIPAAAGSGVVAIAAGGYHTVALKGDGSVVAWGDNYNGQTTIPAAASSDVVAIAAGGYHTVALKSDGSVVAWGYDYDGQATIPAAASSGVVAIAAGGHHTVALKSDGSVVAWGYNGYGQTTSPAAASSGVVAIAAGAYHTVALKSDGSVVAWGDDGLGQTTIPVAATSGVMAVAAGIEHALTLKSDGSVVAWGSDSQGQTTVPFAATLGVIAVAGGGFHSVALKEDGSVIAWGYNASGQTTVPHSTLTVDPGGQVPLGEQVAFTADAGGIACVWDGTSFSGRCVSGEIIDSTRVLLTAHLPANTFIDSWGVGCDETTATTCRIESLEADMTIGPVVAVGSPVVPDAPIMGSAAAGDSSASVSFGPPASHGEGTIWSYTVHSSDGQFATGASSPIIVTGLTNFVSYTFTVTATNVAGTGPASEPSNSVVPLPHAIILASSSNPVLLGAPVTFTATVIGNSPTGTVTFKDGETVLGSGSLDGGRISWTTSDLSLGVHSITAAYGGDAGNTVSASNVLQQAVTTSSGAIAIAAGGGHTVALKSDGSVIAWGYNSSGQTTVPADATSGVVAIAAGVYHTVALKTDGSVVAWGDNDYGQTTVPAAATSGVIAIAAGGTHTVALKSDGSVVAWGQNDDGQTTIPEAATSGIVAIAAGGYHTLALKGDGSVIAWGSNGAGETTIPPAATSGVIAVATGGLHSMALKGNGSVIAWGYDQDSRTTIPDSATKGVVSVAAGGVHSMALKSDGSVSAWGLNPHGQTTVPEAAKSGVIAVAAGGMHSVALKSDGTVIAWGWEATVPSSTVTIAPSGPVPPEETVRISADAGDLDCTWDGTTVSGKCVSNGLITTARVVLTAELPPHALIQSWGEGCDETTTNTCTIHSLTSNTTISPVTNVRHELVVSVVPESGGSVSAEGVNCPGSCSGSFDGPAAVAHLQATPAVGFAFLRWEGDAAGTSPSLELPMTGDKSVTAVFVRTFAVTVDPSGPVPAGATVEFTGSGIDCLWDGTAATGTCTSGSLVETTRVVLTASLPPHAFIASWGSGCDATTATTCMIDSLASDVTISPVTNVRHELVVAVAPDGGGSVSAEGIACPGTCSANFDGPTAVAHLFAVSAPGYAFLHWEGDASGSDASLDLPMTEDRSVSAVFANSVTVCQSGCDYADVGEAVAAAGNGYIILLAPGTWRMNFALSSTKEFTLRGNGATPGATVLNGDTDPGHPGGDGSVFAVSAADGVSTHIRLENLTLTGGAASCGGGLRLEASGSGALGVDLAQVVIRRNAATGGVGGGICAMALAGGALDLSLENVVLATNAATYGGGISAVADGPGSSLDIGVMSTTVGENVAGIGGGARLQARSGGTLSTTVVNSIFSGDRAPTGADLYLQQTSGASATVHASYSDIRARTIASGTFTAGPGMRRDTPVFVNPAKGDFHLNADSPCIDRGTGSGAPVWDYEGNARPQDGGIDLGADERVPQAFSRLTLLALTGGESIPGGKPYDITWGAPAGLVRFMVYVSTDGGATWTLKATKSAASRHFTWTPPRPARDLKSCRVKVAGYNQNGKLVATVKSTRNFTVRRP